MDTHYSNGSNYSYGDPPSNNSSHYSYGQQPTAYASLPNLRSQYDQQHQQQPQQQSQGQPQPVQHQHQHQQQQTLPPLHPQQRASGSSGSLFDQHYNTGRTQAGYPSAAASQLTSGYAPGGPSFGSFANYSNDSLMPQQSSGYGMHHESSAPGYLSDIRSSAFGMGQTLPPLPSTAPYSGQFSGPYDQPSHVVGAQGRRGILPSDDGRPPAVAQDNTGAARASMVPVKDQDGKFPCPHCQKTYLHAKHLKRHLLRHTGDRPYSCFLCNDTFSRSDILKRHFQKCSIRRGNPTGASHLQNSQSHLRKQAAKRTSNELSGKPGSSHDGTKSQPDSETNSLYSTSTSRPASDNFSSLRSDGRTDSSISTMSTPVREKSRSMTGPQPLASIKAEHVSSQPVTPALPTGNTAMSEAPYPPSDTSSHMYSQRTSAASPYRDGNGMTGMAGATHGGQDFEWNNLHAHHGQSGVEYVNPYFNELLGGDHTYNQWQYPHQNGISFNAVAARLIAYMNLDVQPGVDAQIVRGLLTPDNVEHFLTKYLNFHQHWPNVHMPTFNPMTSYPGLVLTMCTVGAAYSERAAIPQVRTLLRVAKTHIINTSDAGRAARDPMADLSALVGNAEVLEQIAALGILTIMVLWHSDPEHRIRLNSDHGSTCQLVRRLGMLEPFPRNMPGFSELHQPDAQLASVTAATFDYASWLRQEKRSRTLYIILQADMGSFLYFNTQPNFGVDEIKLPLPADDAAWEAPTVDECATALGLHGPEAQENYNISGSRRPKQIEFHEAMKVLAHSVQDFKPRSTNAYGKFMLAHGVHVQIWFAHHQQRPANGDFFGGLQSGGYGSSPLSPADWVVNNGSSMPNSGHGTPTPDGSAASGISQQLERQLLKWRKHWDEDDILEYPPDTSQPRVGFCRDGKPFFWLGRMLLKNMHQLDPNAPWQKRFAQMMQALKTSKTLSANEGVSSGLGLTMSADNIDPQYGVDDLTLDMKLLFAPIAPAESPAVQPGGFANLPA